MIRIAGFASYRGTNLRHIDAACRAGHESAGPARATLALLVSNNSGAEILDYAREQAIPWIHLSGGTHPEPDSLDHAIADSLAANEIDLVFLSGYMKRLGPRTVAGFRGRILNVHPSLLPLHGGQGMYGNRVYEEVLASGETRTGATVHIVDEEYDHGPTVLQREVPVEPDDTVGSLAARVRECERVLCVEVVERLGRGELPGVDLAGPRSLISPAG